MQEILEAIQAGASGDDRLDGGTGDDTILAADGDGVDHVTGAEGTDSCAVDRGDTEYSCE